MSGEVLAIADDLSGACEVAAALGGVDVIVEPGPAVEGSVVVNLGTRESELDDHLRELREVLSRVSGRQVFVKIDSLLRGHVAATVRELVSLGRPVTVCPALPEHGRTVVGGVVHVDGVPLHETNLWAREFREAPESIGDLLTGLDVVPIESTLSVARLLPGQVGVCDAVSTQDVVDISRESVRINAVLCGSSALAAGLVVPGVNTPEISNRPVRLCVVVGTASPVVRAQVSTLVGTTDVETVVLPADPQAVWPSVELGKDLTVISIAPTDSPDPGVGARLVDRLAEQVQMLESEVSCDLALVGGETAHAVLARLGVARLRVIGEVAPGTVILESGDRLIATRPGSFGGPDALVQLVNAMKHHRQPREETRHD